MKLTPDEKSLLASVEKGEWKRIPDFPREAARYREAARATLRKDKRVNIRMAERDLVRFQKTAVYEGLPYQTLISSVLHKYINGRMVEKAG
jgi:predicted DNA binding CopG/RHH family protein